MLYKIFNLLWDKLLVTCGALCVLLPTSPMNMPLTGRDSGVFLYIGWRILNGEVPYRDIWDHKPPVIFYINALGLSISGNSRWGVWLIEFVAVFLAAVIGFRLIKKLFGSGPAIISLLLWLLTLVFVISGGNLTTEYTLPLQFACLWLVNDADKKNIPSFRWFLIGVISAMAFFTKQTTVGIGMAIILYITVQRLTSGQLKRWFYEALLIFSGSLTVCIGIIVFFYITGSSSQFWSVAFEYNFVYSSSSISDFVTRLKPIILGITPLTKTGLLQFSLVGYVIGLILILCKKSVTNHWLPLLSVGLFDFPIELIMVSISGKISPPPHYLMTLLPVLSIFVGFTFWVLISQLSSWGISNTAKHTFVIGVLVIFLWVSFHDYRDQVVAFSSVRDETVINYIRTSTTPDDYVLLWGAEASVNYFSHRRSPSRFVYQIPLYDRNFADEQMVEEFLSDVIRNQPRLIIDTNLSLTPMYDFPINTETVQASIAYLRSHYRLNENIGTWAVYEYTGEETAP